MKRTAVARGLAGSTLVALLVGCSSTETSPQGGAGGSSGASGGSSASAGGSSGASGSGGSSGGVGGGDAGTLVGNVTVDLITDDHTAFLGSFFDGPLPAMVPLEVTAEQAGCKLLVPHVVSCDPPCAASDVCAGANVCTRRPMPVSVGTLRVRGLGGMDLALEPTAPTVPSYQVVPTLPYPPCSEGATVEAHADAFDLAATCISALEVTSAVPIAVMTGQPMHLTWKPGATSASRVQIELEISHHGGYRGEIDCDVPDTGAFDIPEPLVTGLVALGRAGYPTVKVARRSIGVASKQPQVRLILSSLSELEVDTGVISCGADSSPPCPGGTTCQTDFTCR